MKQKSKRKTVSRRTRGTAAARNETVAIQITTTRPVVEMVDAVVKTGFYGNCRAAAAERLMCEGLRVVLKEGMIQKRAKVLEQ